MTSFAYVHARPETTDATGIFYVGKGTRARALSVTRGRRNPHYKNVVRKYGEVNILVGMVECSSEAIAFDLERGLLKCLRRMTGARGLPTLRRKRGQKLEPLAKGGIFPLKPRPKYPQR